MRSRYVQVGDYEVYYNIDLFPHPGNGWDDPGEAAEWTITSILDPAGNELRQVESIYTACEDFLMNHPECFDYEDDPHD